MSSEPTEANYRTEQTDASGNRASVIDAARAFGVMLGPSLVLVLYVVLSTGAVVSGWLLRPREGIARLLRHAALEGRRQRKGGLRDAGPRLHSHHP